jgi:hypothetical protein
MIEVFNGPDARRLARMPLEIAAMVLKCLAIIASDTLCRRSDEMVCLRRRRLFGMSVEFLLTVAIAAALYSGGERAAATAIRFGRRQSGDRGEMAVRLAGQAIRSVALGLVVTAVGRRACWAVLASHLSACPFAGAGPHATGASDR